MPAPTPPPRGPDPDLLVRLCALLLADLFEADLPPGPAPAAPTPPGPESDG